MSPHPSRRTSAAATLVVALGLGALGACSSAQPSTPAAAPAASAPAAVDAGAAASSDASDTIDLVNAAVDLPASASVAGDKGDRKADRKGLQARLSRALHATWVTGGKAGPVTHQAIRGEVTAVSATSVTVKAKDGVSMTFTVGADAKVRTRVAVKGAKATDSTVGAVRVGQKALVVGVGATSPTVRRLVHVTPAPATASKTAPAPSSTS